MKLREHVVDRIGSSNWSTSSRYIKMKGNDLAKKRKRKLWGGIGVQNVEDYESSKLRK